MHNGLKLLIIFLIIPLFAAGCTDKDAKGHAGTAPPPPLVKAITVTKADVPLDVEYAAQVDGSREVEVRAQVSGILLERTYREGSFVQEGDILFRIDPNTYHAALEQARGALQQQEANLELARLYRDRTLSIYKQGAVSTHERDDAEAKYEAALATVRTARGSVETAELNLGYTEVRAPISGITSRETRSEGSLITLDASGSLLTTVTRLDPVYVNFSVPGTEVLKRKRQLADGQISAPKDGPVVRLRLSDGNLYKQIGHINFMDRHEDPQTGAVRVRAEVPNPDGMILPGSFARAVMQGMTLKDAVVIPQRAVLFTKNATIVYILDETNVAQPRHVVIGETIGDGFQILSGLSGGERIISDGVIKVRPGVTVTVSKTEVAEAGQGSAQ
ncbi:efflux RND transporter periplasmic adaptor subunit [Desulfovibrio ferrophilus]|uniref:Efflux transporter, RND family, MFP subunit n=1 Tax=Desulfovibrio ferrophilus TaxID=241368 RepID=A0A2Z6AYE4_9BACT|nr:efflux RND transporter periplasmic adaptor subunit [Desulfovibrio ferrophilus]BBD08282.1 efflux transporter, RND family, MFP subunit [Desulfovibrio ferrophilus]